MTPSLDYTLTAKLKVFYIGQCSNHMSLSSCVHILSSFSLSSIFLLADDDDVLVSGWGGKSEEDLSDNLLKLWSDMLEKWDGRDKWDPKGEKTRSRQLVKLVRKVRTHYLNHKVINLLSP